MKLLSDYITLCKPKVVALMLITSWVGMFLATPETPAWSTVLIATIGIGLAASSAAVINHMVDRHIDAKMSRTLLRPIASGRITPKKAFLFAIVLGLISMVILTSYVNPLVALLTFATLLGYAIFYTLFLKRRTPQNIVIGGAWGAMPPLLGWAAISNDINPYSLLLVLIIFTWTPPHFWALAIYRKEDYKKANIPMLPVTHGVPFTKLCIVLYTILLFITTLLPYLTGMSYGIYLLSAIVLGIAFLYYSLRLYLSSDPKEGLVTFNFSIAYLTLLFVALLVDQQYPIAF